MEPLGLFDLLTPYFFGGVDLGPILHSLLATVQVDDYDACYDETGATVWGVARLDETNLGSQFSLGSGGVSYEGNASTSNQPFPAGGVWDWNDLTFQFRIRIPRIPSATVTGVINAVPSVLSSQIPFATLFNAWGYDAGHLPGTAGTPPAIAPSDYPDTQFAMDLLLTVATVHLPFLTGAKLGGDGMLTADSAQQDVRLILPKILLTATQDSTLGSVKVELDSWGAETIDDPDDRGEAQLLQMIPPLALVKGSSAFGFGFDRAILDFSDSHTPPELLGKFGIGTDWQGIYLPDLRVFFAPGGQTGFAVDIDFHDLLIGVGGSSGISCDLEVDVINQDTNPYLRAVFYDPVGNQIAADCSTQRGSEFTIALPENFTCAVEVHSAVPPYQIILDDTQDITATQSFTITGFKTPRDFHLVAKAPSTPPDPHTGKDNTQAELLLHAVPQAQSQNPTIITTPPVGPLTLAPPPPQNAGFSIALVDAQAGQLQFSPFTANAIQVTVTDNAGTTVFTGTLATNTITQVPPPGKTWKIAATWPKVDGVPAPVEAKAYFHYNRPPVPVMAQALPKEMIAFAHSLNGVPKESDLQSTDSSHFEIGTTKDTGNTGKFAEEFIASAEFNDFVTKIPAAGTTISILGFASYEHHDPLEPYNLVLSERRAIALAILIFHAAKDRGPAITFTITAKGNDHDDALLPGGVCAKTAYGPDSTPVSTYDPSEYWMADATYSLTGAGTPATTISAQLTAPAPGTLVIPGPVTIQPITSKDNSRPDWFRYAKLLVRIQQNHFIALELSGEIKFDTAANQLLQQQTAKASLQSHGNPALTAKNLPGNPNPADGTTDFDFILSHDDSTSTWAAQLTIASAKNDKDGLLRFGDAPTNDSNPPDNGFWFDFLSTAIVFAPLIDAVEKPVTNAGTLVQIGVDSAAVGVIALVAGAGIMMGETITLYGATASFSLGDAGFADALMCDVEVDLYLNLLGLIKTRPTKPVKVRYKSVGVRVASGASVGQLALPIFFDPSKGYDIAVSDPGTFHLPAGLDDIVQVLGARIARTNPLNLELDLALKDDLGVVSIDRAKVRWPINPFGVPQITALGATIDIPGAFKASGYLDISDTGIAGSLDLTLIPLGLRARAELAIRQTPPDDQGRTATGVAVSILCTFSAPLVLGCSGLGIFGFIGLFAMHFRRTNPDALAWYVSVNGDPTDVANVHSNGWEAAIGDWAFGAGLILGTLDGGLVLNLKGMVILELPGPRLLFFMSASLFSALPGLLGSSMGVITATLDLDFGRKTLTIGLQIDYKIKPLIQIVIPGDAFFDFTDPSNFQLDLGTIKAPATVKILDTFNGSGYLEIHGNGIPDFPVPGGLQGFSVAVGLTASLIWGDTSINLYLEVTAEAAFGVGFSPFMMAGKLKLGGSLHLFIVSISASGELDVLSDGSDTSIKGSICGEVHFFFFSVSGCVSFSIGPDGLAPSVPELVQSIYLQSRSPALLEGTGTDRPLDTTLLTAPTDPGDANLKKILVPIDSIPVLQFAFTPTIDPAFTSSSIVLPGNPPAPPATSTGWVKRGTEFYRYSITHLELTPINGTPALAGPVPAVWRMMPNAVNGGDDQGLELGLLDWIPFATPTAVVGSSTLDTQITDTWKYTCTPIAAPAAVLWTFSHCALGPSETGWFLFGVAAPDAPGTVRSSPPPLGLKVRELWRTSSPLVDSSLATQPAFVLGRNVPCLPLWGEPPGKIGSIDNSAPSFVRAGAMANFLLPSDTLLPRFQELEAALAAERGDHEFSALLSRDTAGLRHGLRQMAALHEAKTEASLSPLQGEGTLAAAPRQCLGKVLVAPNQRGTDPLAFGDRKLAEALRQASVSTDHIAHQNSDLFDALHFEAVEPRRLRLLLWMSNPLARGEGVVLRAINAGGHGVSDFVIDYNTTPIVQDLTQVPPEWLADPWVREAYEPDEVLLVLRGVDRVDGTVFLVDRVLPSSTAGFILGITSAGLAEARAFPMPYAVAVVEAWSEAEVARETFDAASQVAQQQSVAGALAGNPVHPPLLAPGGEYQISVAYTKQGAPADATGNAPGTPYGAPAAATYTGYFGTDSAAPAVLDPWVLTVWPGYDEGYFFYAEPVTVVFSTNALIPLLAAYHVTLVGHSRAASFRHSAVTTSGPGQPTQPLTGLQDVPGLVLTPFEEALRHAVESGALGCIDGSGSSTRHSRKVFDFPLDPLTGYIFDLEEEGAVTPPPVHPPATVPPVKPMYRAAFTTSRYATLSEMIAVVGTCNAAHRHAAAGSTAALATLASTCTEADFESALRAAGFGAVARAPAPRLTILWEDVPGSKARPAGIFLDLPEPIRRSRPTPTPTFDPNPQNDPARQNRIISWSIQPQVWLDLAEAPGETNLQRLAVSSSGTRVYLTLKPGLAPGAALSLVVKRSQTQFIEGTDTPLVLPLLTLTFNGAPWEDA